MERGNALATRSDIPSNSLGSSRLTIGEVAFDYTQTANFDGVVINDPTNVRSSIDLI
jgi:hypothetical protein